MRYWQTIVLVIEIEKHYNFGLTLRCLTLLDGALVGVIVTEGVIVRLDPVRVNPIGSR